MIGYALRGKNVWKVLSPLVSVLLFCMIFPILHIQYQKIILLPIILLHINTIMLYATPPSILLLGSSRWESVRLFNLIERGIFPYRVIVLLEPTQTEFVLQLPAVFQSELSEPSQTADKYIVLLIAMAAFYFLDADFEILSILIVAIFSTAIGFRQRRMKQDKVNKPNRIITY